MGGGLPGCAGWEGRVDGRWFGAGVVFAAEGLVAVAADDAGVCERVWAAVFVGDDVVGFGAVGAFAVGPVEPDAAFGAVCEALVLGLVECLCADSFPGGGAGAGAGDGRLRGCGRAGRRFRERR